MSDEQNQFTPPPPAPPGSGPGPDLSGGSSPGNLGAPMPPPPLPPTMGMPIMMPSPLPKKRLVSRIKDALVLMVFFGSIVLNLFLAISLAGQQVDGQIRETVIRDGALEQQMAVIDVKGIITDEMAGQLWPQFQQVTSNKKYKALLLYVNSPGGGVTASDTIAHYVDQVRAAGKPVVAFMGTVAASGGYYVSAGADYIMTGPTTITGSIGVLAQLPKLHGTLEMMGAEMIVIPSTPATKKAMGSPFVPWSPASKEYFQTIIDSAHNRFVEVVYQGRQKHFEDISVLEKLANGAALTAGQAKEAKLVDQTDAYLEDAIEKTAALAELDKPRVVRLSRPATFAERLTGAEEAHSSLLNIDASLLDELTTPRLLYLWQGQ